MRKTLILLSFYCCLNSNAQYSTFVEVLPVGLMVHQNKIGFYGKLIGVGTDFFYGSLLNYHLSKDSYIDYLSGGLSLPFMANDVGMIKLNGGIALNHYWKEPFEPDPSENEGISLINIPGRIFLEYNSAGNIFNITAGHQTLLHFFENKHLTELNKSNYINGYEGFFFKLTLNLAFLFDFYDTYEYNGTYISNLGRSQKYKPPKQKKTKIVKKIETAILEIQKMNFVDENKNNRIDGNEDVYINLVIKNNGNVTSGNITVNIRDKNELKGLNYNQTNSYNSISSKGSRGIKLHISSDDKLETNLAHFIIEVKEGSKQHDKAEILIPTQKKKSKKIQIGYISDVDINIPKSNRINENIYAVIIGNEDYSSRQPNLSKESNVPYANNDAEIFYEYSTKTLGIPEINITFLRDATTSEINQAIDKLTLLAKLKGGNAKLIFYYAGHGLPDQSSKNQYLIPVDVSSSNIQFVISVNDLIKKLNEYPCEQVTIILDACFSGGARNKSLLSYRGIKITPKDLILKGNLVIFSSSSDDEVSQSYPKQNHGMFTYYLLKKLQETKGNTTYEELAKYLEENIMLQSVLINNSLQTPSIKISPEVINEWNLWKFK